VGVHHHSAVAHGIAPRPSRQDSRSVAGRRGAIQTGEVATGQHGHTQGPHTHRSPGLRVSHGRQRHRSDVHHQGKGVSPLADVLVRPPQRRPRQHRVQGRLGAHGYARHGLVEPQQQGVPGPQAWLRPVVQRDYRGGVGQELRLGRVAPGAGQGRAHHGGVLTAPSRVPQATAGQHGQSHPGHHGGHHVAVYGAGQSDHQAIPCPRHGAVGGLPRRSVGGRQSWGKGQQGGHAGVCANVGAVGGLGPVHRQHVVRGQAGGNGLRVRRHNGCGEGHTRAARMQGKGGGGGTGVGGSKGSQALARARQT
jgi:hypothetical protein